MSTISGICSQKLVFIFVAIVSSQPKLVLVRAAKRSDLKVFIYIYIYIYTLKLKEYLTS